MTLLYLLIALNVLVLIAFGAIALYFKSIKDMYENVIKPQYDTVMKMLENIEGSYKIVRDQYKDMDMTYSFFLKKLEREWKNGKSNS